MKNKEHCVEQTWRNVQNACSQEKKWQISKRPDEDDEDDECQVKMLKPDVNRFHEVATPEECRKIGSGQGVRCFNVQHE